jgi:signal transduction histidine kinase
MKELSDENQRLRSERDLLRRRLAEVEETFMRAVQESQQATLAMNEALAQANSQLQEIDRMKDDFLSMVTHELRTPLTVISGTTEMLETGVYGELTSEQSEHIRQISAQAGRLRDLVNDLLDLSKMESGLIRLRRQMLDPRSLAEAVIHQLATMAAQADVTVKNLVRHDLPEIYCDGQRIEQVLVNLLTNAIKFSLPASEIIISAEFETSLTGPSVRFCVADHGRGIPEDALPRVFDKFYQVQSSTESRTKGTGLGLSIVRRIIELHGGQVSVESAVNQGSRFCFTLPTVEEKR